MVFLLWHSELQDHSVILGKSTGKVVIQHSIPLAQKATLGPVQTSSGVIPGKGWKTGRLGSSRRKREVPVKVLPAMREINQNTKTKQNA